MNGSLCSSQIVFVTNETMSQHVGDPLQKEPSDEDLLRLFSNPEFSFHRHWWVQSLLISLYASLAAVGLLTNVMVVALIVYHHALHNITNIFVLALALSDISLCSFNIPLQVAYEMKENLQLSAPLCKLFFFAFAVPMHVSCLTMLYIAVDRYRIILHPLLPRMTPRCAVGMLLATVAFSLLNALPVAWSVTVQSPFPLQDSWRRNSSGLNFMYCVEHWTQEQWRLVYSLYNAAVLFILPLSLTALLYIRVYCRLQGRAFKQRDLERKRRTNRILAAIVFSFAICWTPWTCFSTFLEIQAYYHHQQLEQVYRSLTQSDCFSNVAETNEVLFRAKINLTALSWITPWTHHYMKFTDMVLKLLALSSSCINPFLYGWLNDSIRESIQRLFLRCRVCVTHESLELVAGGAGSDHRGNRNPPQGGGENANYATREGDSPYSHAVNMEASSSRYTPSAFDNSTKRTSLYPSTLIGHSPRNSLLPQLSVGVLRNSVGTNLLHIPSVVGVPNVTGTVLPGSGMEAQPTATSVIHHPRGSIYRFSASGPHLPTTANSTSISNSPTTLQQLSSNAISAVAASMIAEESSSTTTTQPPVPEESSSVVVTKEIHDDLEEITLIVPSYPFQQVAKVPSQDSTPASPIPLQPTEEPPVDANELSSPSGDTEQKPIRRQKSLDSKPAVMWQEQKLLPHEPDENRLESGLKKRTFSISNHRSSYDGHAPVLEVSPQAKQSRAEIHRLSRRQTIMAHVSNRFSDKRRESNEVCVRMVIDPEDAVEQGVCHKADVDDFAYFRLIAAEEENKKAELRRNSAEVHHHPQSSFLGTPGLSTPRPRLSSSSATPSTAQLSSQNLPQKLLRRASKNLVSRWQPGNSHERVSTSPSAPMERHRITAPSAE